MLEVPVFVALERSTRHLSLSILETFRQSDNRPVWFARHRILDGLETEFEMTWNPYVTGPIFQIAGEIDLGDDGVEFAAPSSNRRC